MIRHFSPIFMIFLLPTTRLDAAKLSYEADAVHLLESDAKETQRQPAPTPLSPPTSMAVSNSKPLWVRQSMTIKHHRAGDGVTDQISRRDISHGAYGKDSNFVWSPGSGGFRWNKSATWSSKKQHRRQQNKQGEFSADHQHKATRLGWYGADKNNHARLNMVLLMVHIAKTGGSSFDEILKNGVNGTHADCIVAKKHYEDMRLPLEQRFDFPNCQIISTEFSRFQAARLLIPATTFTSIEGTAAKTARLAQQVLHSERVCYLTLMREPFARLLSQYRHDKLYTSRRFSACKGLGMLVEKGCDCIAGGELAYRYQNFQSMMLGGCVWSQRERRCVPLQANDPRNARWSSMQRAADDVGQHPSTIAAEVTPAQVLAQFNFLGINEYFEASVCLFFFTVGDKHLFRSYCGGERTPANMRGQEMQSQGTSKLHHQQEKKVARGELVKEPSTSSQQLRRAVPHIMRGATFSSSSSDSLSKQKKNGYGAVGGSSAAVLEPNVLRAAMRTNELDFRLYWTAHDQFKARVKAMGEKTGVHLFL